MKRTYEILAIDVWGNPRDGFEINDSHKTGVTFDVSDEDTDTQVLKNLRKALGHKASAYGYHAEYPYENFFSFCRNSDGKPCYQAQEIDA